MELLPPGFVVRFIKFRVASDELFFNLHWITESLQNMNDARYDSIYARQRDVRAYMLKKIKMREIFGDEDGVWLNPRMLEQGDRETKWEIVFVGKIN